MAEVNENSTASGQNSSKRVQLRWCDLWPRVTGARWPMGETLGSGVPYTHTHTHIPYITMYYNLYKCVCVWVSV